jgi:membrane protein YdbS with pleckstrin-like domain
MKDHRPYKLGGRAFLLFLMRRIKFSLFLFVLTAAVWYSVRFYPQGYAAWGNYASEILFFISIAYFLVVLLRTYTEYRVYTFTFTEEAFVVTKGYITKSEIAALYHQIQNVNIERTPFDRMGGVSSVVIFLSGGQHDSPHNRIVLPAVERERAKLVQQELLVRARKHFRSPESQSEPASRPRR